MWTPPSLRTLGIGLAAALIATGCAAKPHKARKPPPPPRQPPVWIVKDQDSEMLLFGSVHILPPKLGWEPPALSEALKTADDIWFELPIDAQSEADVAKLARERGVLGPNQSLFKMLPLEDAGRMARVAQTYGISAALLDRLQPWLAEVALAEGAYKQAGADANAGVEQTLAAEVPPATERRAFETPAEQIDVLAGGDLHDQLASLHETLVEMEDQPNEYATLIKAWLDGDLGALEREALDPLRKASPTLFRRLVTDRNARWTSVLKARMAGQGHTVVVVGMGHLIGPDGLPARLRAAGFQVTGPGMPVEPRPKRKATH